jgi:hypothetical protein
MKTLTPTAVNKLKLEAKQLKKSANITHSAALAQIAHREGYSSWESLIAKAGGAPARKDSEAFAAEQQRRADQWQS